MAADSGTTLDDVRAKLEAAFGDYDTARRPEPQPHATRRRRDSSVLSSAVRRGTVVEIEYLGRQADLDARGASSSPTTCAAYAATGTCDTWIDTATLEPGERTFRVDRIHKAQAAEARRFERRASLTCTRRRRARRSRGHGVFWFSAKVARWELEGRADTNRLADGAAIASVPYGSERWLVCGARRYLGEAILLEPESLRARVAERARELAALVRAHATTSTS